MKQLFLAILILGLHFLAGAQESDPKFTVTVSSDSILLGNYFRVTFTLENAGEGDFEAPSFDGFTVISGPNYSTSMSMVNGKVSQKISYNFYLEPIDIGNYYIQPASITVGDNVMETLPLPVMVVPNPDGVKQSIPEQQDLEWGGSFNDGFPDIFEQFFKNRLQPDLTPPPSTPAPREEKPQKKKKIYKM
ncbi:MAG TPA: BatD family protein [Flavilitoribacter sp.]|nr:BatD family protein [Flavilitoribacter sp.]